MTTGCATTTTNTTTAAASATTANFVYILSKEHAWVPARVISMFEQRQQAMVSVPMYHDEQSIQSDAGRKAKRQVQQVIDLKHHHYNQGRLPLQNVDENGRLQEVEDMVDLPFLHEAAILYNLKARHVQSKPYTRTGDIIIAVNPYQWITDLYTERTQAKYSQSLVWNHPQLSSSSSFDDARKMVEPHVYEASALAYRGLALLGENQSILVSGESGAGKTETVKICMNHIASIQRGCCDTNNNAMDDDEEADRRSSNGSGSSKGGAKKSFISPVVQRVLDSNPLLEAFGNAKTVRNDNSSRFGKYIQLQFDVEDVVSAAYAGKAVPRCVLAGSKCEVYLLEKSRVVGHDEHERTYHIFYQLLAADDKLKTYFWEGLRGTNHESFNYVGWTDTHKIEGVTDARRFIKTLESLGLIGVRGAQLQTLMRALCIVLQLGNLVFEGNDGDEERAAIDLNDDFLALSELIGIQPAALEEAFLLRTVRARNEVYKVPLNVAKAKDSVDAFAKEIYAKTFLWLVRTINNATCAERNYDGDRKDGFGVIGLLDIFGFESFQTNRFEQLCINYANEKLQQKFTQDVFQSVQAEYQDEGIHLDEIKYDDNTNVLDLIEGKLGLLAVLNEECVRPKGNDTSFVAKALELNKTSPCLLTTKMFQSCAFGIVHFAGKVMYDATNFVSKNQDTLPTDLQECATKSSNGILAKELFNESTMVTTTTTTTTRKSKGQEPPLARRQSNLMAATVWTKFRTQLNCLMASLKDTRTRYIRCIKPNSKKKALLMEHVSTVEQLRCAGVVAAVTISRSAFPNRLEHPIVLERFKSLWPKEGANALYDEEAMRRLVDNVLTQVLKPLEVVDKKRNVIVKAFVIGNTRAYFRAGALEYLEKERLNGMDTWATDIQRTARGFLARRRCRRVRAAVIVCQSHVRTFLVRHQLRRLYRACVFAQCWIRSLLAQRALANCRYSSKVMMIQNTWRARQTRITFLMYRQAALVVQTVARGFIQRRKFRRLLREKKEEASLTRQLEHLKAALREAEIRRLEAEQRAEERARQRFEEQWEEEKNLEAETAAITNEQQSLIEESTKIIEYLRKENAKLRQRNTKIQDDFDVIKRNNARLLEANASASESFAALNEYARQLNDSNSKLVKSLCSYKSRCAKLKEGLRRMHEHIKFNGSSSPVSVYQLLDPPEQIAI